MANKVYEMMAWTPERMKPVMGYIVLDAERIPRTSMTDDGWSVYNNGVDRLLIKVVGLADDMSDNAMYDLVDRWNREERKTPSGVLWDVYGKFFRKRGSRGRKRDLYSRQGMML